MAYPLKAYYGRKTYAFLDCCCFCGREYDESGEWNTLQGGGKRGDVWFIACDECMEKLEGECECEC